ncbi:protein canopy homolog 2-like isoform X2 [Tigriopus californicus]|uniref:protein canopy homolog 2-like isoform X2 n=1 Tax=Tigriopus californicus TaxID=6832 RepID=UPI0027DA1B26|nr:protein canopy homolog 2-like isoform X2 [Tigriopus californicus]
MNHLRHILGLALILYVLISTVISQKAPPTTQPFSSKSLKCLVCQAMVEEFMVAIGQMDPQKKVEVGGFRLGSDGTTDRKVVPYLRSEGHLAEIMETLCEQFEDYAQAQTKGTGRPTLIRITHRDGGMNPHFGAGVDIVPDEDLNTRLKFYCESVLEEEEEHFQDVMAQPQVELWHAIQILCQERSHLCGINDIHPPRTHPEL